MTKKINNNYSLYILFCIETHKKQQENLKYISVPTISGAQCNSTNHFAGSLPADSICTEHIESNTTCYVSIISVRLWCQNEYISKLFRILSFPIMLSLYDK